MAATPEGQQLTEQHRLDQVAIKAAFLAQFVQLWPVLSWTALDATSAVWVRASMSLIRRFRQRSALRAERYYRDFRLIEGPASVRLSPLPPIQYVHAPAADELAIDLVRDVRNADSAAFNRDLRRFDDARRDDRGGIGSDFPNLRIDWAKSDAASEQSLLVTGPGELKRQAAMGRTEQQAKDRGLVVVSGSASRQVLNGGRTATLELVYSDPTPIGWVRVTDGDPCAFCAMLAGRGLYRPYRTAESAGFQAHDACACTAEPVYSRRAALPGRGAEFQRLWKSSTQGYSGKDARNAFRRSYEAKRREAAAPQPLTA